MSLKLSVPFGDQVTRLLARALAFQVSTSGREEYINPESLQLSRETAFLFASDPETFAWEYLLSEVFSKYDNGDPTRKLELEREAFRQFRRNERWCGQVNDRLADVWIRCSTDLPKWRRARAIVAGILGRFPWEELPWACGFGPGASTSLKRLEASPQNKWGLSSHITEGALPYHQAFLKWSGLSYIPSEMGVVEGNRVTTVAKNWKSRRIIAVEPDWNMFYQKGVGSLIRRRLQRRGLLTPDAQEKSRAMAALGSVTGNLATLDLASASDSVTLGLCQALLPEDWLKVILDLRSPVGTLRGQPITYEKVSSMGNGFTFELETLLFYALTLACCEKGTTCVTVYGDDIICPSDRAGDVAGVLLEAGFWLNVDKSFWDGPFRESCGGHFWNGRDVTPFYYRRPFRHQADALVLHNAVMAWCSVDPRARDYSIFSLVTRACRQAVPKKFWGPYGHDGVLWADWDEVCPSWCVDTQSYEGWRLVGKTRYQGLYDSDGAYLHGLWTESEEVRANADKWAVKDHITVSKYYHDRDQYVVLPVQ